MNNAIFLEHGYDGTEPGTICHIGVAGNHIRDDVHFVFGDDAGIRIKFPESSRYDLIMWGDVIEFHPYPTVWLLEKTVGTQIQMSAYPSRIPALQKFIEETKVYDDSSGVIQEAVRRFEDGRRESLRFLHLFLHPVRLFQ